MPSCCFGNNDIHRFESDLQTTFSVIFYFYFFKDFFSGIDGGQMRNGRERGEVTCSRGPPAGIRTGVPCVCGMSS